MKRKILVVDDDWATLELLKLTFTSSGFEVFLAQNEQEFRHFARAAQKPDIIILDIMLGEADGVHIYEELLAEGFDARIPVVFLSVLAKDLAPQPPQQGRTYALVAKPFDPDKLVKEISCLVGD